MMTTIQHFILVFDHSKGHLTGEPLEYGQDSESALARYSELEEEFRSNTNMDIVLIGSDSLDTVKVTHANYFDGTAAFAKYLNDIQAQRTN
ncbi:bifunctional phosphoribosylaminoimidazolecarboxamide formyltransferase/IMP cyclohydrolase [Leifsonia xyli subsp. cynodontis DSM 46306]|uniref:Uncharacterized protein n=2 Tax=Leifsonia xyli TaxID=1575 RepID=U3PA99_LEIXC|nr:bifunctional phosphoribosylaminoimidazolecarboxamide formyltransferase/IMP cyclohydrolase [Leifsonia xyli subsp. cynodontis DSM 46306]AGW42530.1 bifunctional phosphoribosylaminoimidazolecarboxamide formyltransferase/IMP cyclohydrolase [Leifsonia xyli subsp. cynodontis DSM 46306]